MCSSKSFSNRSPRATSSASGFAVDMGFAPGGPAITTPFRARSADLFLRSATSVPAGWRSHRDRRAIGARYRLGSALSRRQPLTTLARSMDFRSCARRGHRHRVAPTDSQRPGLALQIESEAGSRDPNPQAGARKGPAAARPDFSPSTQVLELRKLPLSFRLQRQFVSAGIVPTHSAPILPDADQRKRTRPWQSGRPRSCGGSNQLKLINRH
jgi:hypothetical protein